jgi:hypothetical protein
LAREARQMVKFARRPFAKTTANCSISFCHFHLISSVSRPQQPLLSNLLQCLLWMTVISIFYLKSKTSLNNKDII